MKIKFFKYWFYSLYFWIINRVTGYLVDFLKWLGNKCVRANNKSAIKGEKYWNLAIIERRK